MKKYEYAVYQLGAQPSTKGLDVAVQSKIHEYVDQGYEFHSQVYVPVTINPGCLGSFIGEKARHFNAPIFIFRKEV